MSQAGSTSSGSGGTGIQTILGDTGSITGSTVTIYADNAAVNSGSSVEFVNSGTISTLNLTDINTNTLIGNTTGNLTLSGTENVGLGYSVLSQLTTGSYNVAVGDLSGGNLQTGSENVAVGYRALASSSADDLNTAIGYGAMVNTNGGQFNVAVGPVAGGNIISGSSNISIGSNSANSYGGAESDNILLNSFGIGGENNTLHIGDLTGTGTGTNSLNAAYIQGISGNNQPVAGSIQFVTIDASGTATNGLLGVTTTASGSVTLTPDTGHGSPVSGADIAVQAFSDPNFPNNAGSSVWFYGDTTTSPQTLVFNVTDANSNTIIGQSAGNGSITGIQNVGLGTILTALTSGRTNVAIGGANPLNVLTTGSFNIAIGGDALGSSVADSNNVAIGVNALSGLNGGSNNTGIGYAALGNNSGTFNNLTAIGYQALGNVASSSTSTAIGYNALQNSIADSANTAVGDQSLQALNGGSSNTAIGSSALYSSTADSNNTAVGSNALYYNNGGNSNVAVGGQCLFNMITGVANTAMGYDALQASTADSENCAFGYSALVTLNGGQHNNALGVSALQNSQTCTDNNAFGWFALAGNTTGSSNTAIGSETLFGCQTGNYNVGIGESALGSTNSGSQNIGIGYGAFNVIGTGNYNVGIGHLTGTNCSLADSDNIMINSGGVAGDSSTLRIGQATGIGNQNLNAAYIQGIYSNNQPVSGTVELVTIDNTTGLLGVTSVAGSGATLNPDTGRGASVSGTSINVQAFSDPNFPNNCGSTVYFYGDTTTTPETLVLNVTDSNTNTLIGKSSGTSIVTGNNNVALGNLTLQALTSGTFNTAIGDRSLYSLTSGNNNMAIGYFSLYASNDNNNTSIGYGTLQALNGGNNNSALGIGIATALSYGSNNSMIGISSGSNYSAGESDNILLNSAGVFDESNTLHIGDLTGTGTGTNSLNAAYIQGISGNTQPISGTIQYVTIDTSGSSSNGLLGVTSTAAGSITLIDDFSNSISANTINLITNRSTIDGNYNTSGSSVTFNADGTTSPNSYVFQLSDNAQNNILGSGSGNLTLSGTQNTIVGSNSFTASTNDNYNCTLGYFTLPGVAGGANYNIAIGYGAGQSYAGGETANILLASSGYVGESNAMRLGNVTGGGAFGINQAYLCGITANSQPQGSGIYVVTVNSNAGQTTADRLGYTTITPGQLSWSDQGVSFNAVVGNGYFCTAALTSTLPSGSSEGDTIEFYVDNSASFVVRCAAGQILRIGSGTTTVAGTATNHSWGDALTCVFRTATNTWAVTNSVGTWTLA